MADLAAALPISGANYAYLCVHGLLKLRRSCMSG